MDGASKGLKKGESKKNSEKPQNADSEIRNSTILASYSLAEFQKLAASNNPTLIQAKAQVAGERGKALQAGLPPNPSISYSTDLMGARQAGLGEFQGGVLQQEVVLGRKLAYSRKKYQSRATAAEQQEQAQYLRVMNDVAVSFYRTLAAAEKLKVQRDFLKSARDSWLTKKEMFNVGQANKADLHQVNIEFEKQVLAVQTAENDLHWRWQQLMAVVGIEAEYNQLDGSLDLLKKPQDEKALLEQLLANSPELGEAKAKLRSDEITVQRERRQRVPDLLMCGGPGYDQLDKTFATVAMASLVNLPVFNRNQGTIKQAEADLSRQQAQVRLIELQLKTRLAFHYRNYLTASQHVEGYRNVIIPESEERYKVRLISYQNDRLDWPQVLEAQRDFLAARLANIDYQLDLQESAIALQGYLLTGGLIPPPGVTPPGHIDATPQPR
jgi:outer membrane protein TolC